MDYTNILKRAWNIVWNNKFMFVLGFLAALSSGGGGGGSNFNFNSGSGSGPDIPPEIVQNIEQYWAQFAFAIVAVVLLLVLLGILFWLVSLVGKAGLISSAARLDAGEKVTLRQAFSAGTSKLGRLVGLNLLLYGPFIIVGLIAFMVIGATVGTALFAELSGTSGSLENIAGAAGIMALCFGILACLLVPVGLVVNLIYPFSLRGLVLYDYAIMDSVRHGWKVLRDNIGEIFLLIILFLVIGFLFGIAAAIVLVPLAAIIFLPVILPMINGGTFEAVNIVFLIFGGIVLGILGAAINSIMIAFRSTVVTLAYQEFVNKPGVEKAV